MSAWQLIEAAPKERRILLGGLFYGENWEAMTGIIGSDGLIHTDDPATGDWICTHWMPLPPPPSPEKTG